MSELCLLINLTFHPVEERAILLVCNQSGVVYQFVNITNMLDDVLPIYLYLY